MGEDLDFSNLASLATPAESVAASASTPAAAIVPPESYLPETRPKVVSSRAVGTLPMLYDSKLALRFFSIAGQEENFVAGTQIFAEQEKASGFFSKGAKVYLLLSGEVTLTVKGKPLSMMLPGETFGELAVISAAPRAAAAVARKNCQLLSLDEKRFLSSFQQVPEFALMLISIMMQRLQVSITRLLASTKQTFSPHTGLPGLSPAELKTLRHAMGDPSPTKMQMGDAIVSKGSLGALMFVLLSGQVSTALDGRVVEHLGPGGIFGETAMLGPSVRAATVSADTDGAWLPVSRGDFLDIVKSHPAIGVALLRSLSERILATTDLLRLHSGAE